MTAGPAVSVLMAVYDGERYLREAVASILCQTFSDFEFLVVDDGSTDGTADILRSYGDPRIRLLRNPRNLGLAASLNRGIDEARGRYIARMDADDISLAERLARQVAFLDDRPEIGACGTWYRLIGERDEETRLPTDAAEIKCCLFFRNVLAHPTVVLRTGAFRGAGLRYDVSYRTSQDYDLWVRASRRFPLANLGESLLHFRIHPDQAARRHRGRQAETARIVRRRQVEELGILPGDEELRIHDMLCMPSGGAALCSEERADAWVGRLKAANRAKGLFPDPVFSRVLDEQLEALHRAAAVSRQSDRGSAWRRAVRRFLGSRPPAVNAGPDGRPAEGPVAKSRRSGRTALRLSVVVCSRNRSAMLARVLESLCDQTLDRSLYEVVVVDNGSTDATRAVAEEFARRHPNVRYVREERVGLSHARNRGWMEADGEYVAYTDDDCKAPPEWLAAAKEIVDARAPALFGGPYYAFYDSPKPRWWKDAYRSLEHAETARPLGAGEYLSGGNVFIRRDVFARVGGFDPGLGMAGETIAMGEETRFIEEVRRVLPDALIYYEPRLFVRHLVPARKMAPGWLVRHWLAAGRSSWLLFRVSSARPARAATLFGMARTAAGLAGDVLRALVARDRLRHPYIQNHLFERSSRFVVELGRLHEQWRAIGRGDPRAVEPAKSDAGSWPELGLEDFVRREACPSCGSAGALPLAGGTGSLVGGRRFVRESLRYGERLRKARRILCCRRCGLSYQEWVPTRELILRLYGTTGERDPWPPDPRRLTWSRALGRLPARPGRILDVGANDGHFLSQLPPGWVRASLEPAGAARGATLERATEERYVGFLDDPSLPGLPSGSFDVVCLFDVAEHLRDVGTAMSNLFRVLAPGGMAVIETGNARCLPAKFLGNRWWYYDYIEHFVFFGPETLRKALEAAGLRIEECRRVVHTRMGGRLRMGVDLAAKLFRAGLPDAGGDRGGSGGEVRLEHPLRIYWPDHLFVLARKDPDRGSGGPGPCA